MNCKKPYLRGVLPYPCGQCLPCRINRRRLWTHRILLEAKCHERSIFTTLTYAPDHLPAGGSLDRGALSGFVKRFRKNHGRKLRFFGVGEYGDQSGRPHYHVVLFGVGPSAGPDVEKSWSFGHVDVRELSAELAQYVAGYVVKKLTNDTDPRLKGRIPEYTRMSLRPGIGALAVPALSRTLETEQGSRLVAELGDVPVVVRHGRRLLPVGRYLRRQLRASLGFDEIGGQVAPQKLQLEEMLALRAAYPSRSAYERDAPFIDFQKVAQIEGRADIFKKRSKL